jgi:hypothetical protein
MFSFREVVPFYVLFVLLMAVPSTAQTLKGDSVAIGAHQLFDESGVESEDPKADPGKTPTGYVGACHFECASYGSQVSMNLIGKLYSNDKAGDQRCAGVANSACRVRGAGKPLNVFTRPAFVGEFTTGTTTKR